MGRQLADYQVGALSPAARHAVEQHLQQCAACRAELTALNRTVTLLQPMPQLDAPSQVWGQIAHQLTPRRRAVPVLRWTPALAAALLLLLVAMAFVLPLLQGHLPAVAPQDSFSDVQLAASWDNPLADKAALGLAGLATSDRESDFIQEIVD